MATRKQVLVQLDDEMLAELDEVARELNVNRSEVVRRQLRRFLEYRRHERGHRQAAEAYRRMPETQEERLERDAWRLLAAKNDLPYDE